MNKKTLAIFVVSMVLVCALSIMGTIAYLTGQSETVTNTFVSGNVTISLDEVKMNADGTAVLDGTTRTTKDDPTNTYKMIPSTTYTKDPTIHITEESENCYLGAVITVSNVGDVFAAEDAKLSTFGITLKNGWTPAEPTATISADGSTWTFKVIYETLCTDENLNVVIFDSITIPDLDNDKVAKATDETSVKIDVTAYAVQQTGFNSAAAALAGGFGTIFGA